MAGLQQTLHLIHRPFGRQPRRLLTAVELLPPECHQTRRAGSRTWTKSIKNRPYFLYIILDVIYSKFKLDFVFFIGNIHNHSSFVEQF